MKKSIKPHEPGTPPGPAKAILLVEDDEGLRRQMQWALEPYRVVAAANRGEAISCLKTDSDLRIVVLDLGLPPDPDGTSEGLEILEEILDHAPQTKVIIVSGNSDRNAAIAAVGRGAFDFIPKPVDIDVLKIVIDRAARVYDLEYENRALKTKTSGVMRGIVYASAEMERISHTIERVARTNASVLILGESGTGKELIANALHGASDRKDARLVAINCASIPEHLLESELFGHERGAFTGAVKQTLGKFEIANKGTLFLDEIGDMPLPLQAKLLRFLQSHQFERVGGRTTLTVDVRVVSATNKPLETLIQSGGFREDLYYRLNEFRVELPALRSREGDAILLARHFAHIYANENGRNFRGFSKGATLALQVHPWPGNVRELENRVKRAVIMAQAPLISEIDLELAAEPGGRNLNLREHVRTLEGNLLREAFAVAGGNVSRIAKLMGISRPQVYTLMEAHEMRDKIKGDLDHD
jgi:two-component system NtrC family response regulator